MDNTEITLEIIDGIYDIQPLTAPALSNIELLIFAILIVSFFILTSYFIWHRIYSKKAVSKRNITRLQKRYVAKEINSHDTIFQISLIIKNRLNIHTINEFTGLPVKLSSYIIDWQ